MEKIDEEPVEYEEITAFEIKYRTNKHGKTEWRHVITDDYVSIFQIIGYMRLAMQEIEQEILDEWREKDEQ